MIEFLSKFFSAEFRDDKMLKYLSFGLFLGVILILLLYILRIYNRRKEKKEKSEKESKKKKQ